MLFNQRQRKDQKIIFEQLSSEIIYIKSSLVNQHQFSSRRSFSEDHLKQIILPRTSQNITLTRSSLRNQLAKIIFRISRDPLESHMIIQYTVGHINQKPRCKYWITRLSIRLLARTAHLFACSALLASLTHSAPLTRLLTHLLTPELARQWLDGYLFCVSLYSGPQCNRSHVVED